MNNTNDNDNISTSFRLTLKDHLHVSLSCNKEAIYPVIWLTYKLFNFSAIFYLVNYMILGWELSNGWKIINYLKALELRKQIYIWRLPFDVSAS